MISEKKTLRSLTFKFSSMNQLFHCLAYFKPYKKLKLILISDDVDVRHRNEVNRPAYKGYWPDKLDEEEVELGEGDYTKLKFTEVISEIGKAELEKCQRLILSGM